MKIQPASQSILPAGRNTRATSASGEPTVKTIAAVRDIGLGSTTEFIFFLSISHELPGFAAYWSGVDLGGGSPAKEPPEIQTDKKQSEVDRAAHGTELRRLDGGVSRRDGLVCSDPLIESRLRRGEVAGGEVDAGQAEQAGPHPG